MYKIKVDGKTLYSSAVSDEEYSILDGKLTEELNKAGSLTFTISPKNAMYSNIQKLKSDVVVEQDGKEIWWGRVLNDEKDWYNRKNVYCEGMLAYLNDSVVRPYDYTGSIVNLFGQFIIQHNKHVDSSKQFMLRATSDMTGNVNYANSNYPNTLSEMMEKLVNNNGGYVHVTRSVVGQNWAWYTTEAGELSDQTIRFGENLLDLTEYVDATNVFTRLVPLGKRAETEDGKEGKRLTIESVNGGLDYVEDTTAEKIFGIIERSVIWEDVTEASNLLRKAKEALKANIEMAVTLSIKAVDLHILDVNTSRINLGDYVHVVSAPHGLDKNFLCSKIETDLLNPDKSEFTFGAGFTAMTEKQVAERKVSNKAFYSASDANAGVSQISVNVSGNYLSTADFAAYEKQVNENFDSINTKLEKTYRVRGSVDSYDKLPASAAVGDVYNVSDTGANYVWTSDGWDKLSEDTKTTSASVKDNVLVLS